MADTKRLGTKHAEFGALPVYNLTVASLSGRATTLVSSVAYERQHVGKDGVSTLCTYLVLVYTMYDPRSSKEGCGR